MIDNMFLKRFTVGSYPINGYLLADPETHIGVFIDPGGFNDEIAACIEDEHIQLRFLFFTHGHWDHTEGLSVFMNRYSVKGYAGQNEVAAASHTLHGGESIDVGKLHFTALNTPGHTAGGISYYCNHCVFTGDALFCGSVGGTSSVRDGQLQIDQVRKNIFTLPDQTLIFPAHGPMSTVAAEKYANPFFK
ncbi:MAG: MBL fold metallo-hydrolase [Sedimentisphaerales bacterium]|nr:MBL fold metallo-hydrolase [Sedimentisphaerales bacterium]